MKPSVPFGEFQHHSEFRLNRFLDIGWTALWPRWIHWLWRMSISLLMPTDTARGEPGYFQGFHVTIEIYVLLNIWIKIALSPTISNSSACFWVLSSKLHFLWRIDTVWVFPVHRLVMCSSRDLLLFSQPRVLAVSPKNCFLLLFLC